MTRWSYGQLHHCIAVELGIGRIGCGRRLDCGNDRGHRSSLQRGPATSLAMMSPAGDLPAFRNHLPGFFRRHVAGA
jgi:hypothetical protein